MMKATDVRYGDNLSAIRFFYRSWHRTLLRQGQMRTGLEVIGQVGSEQLPQVPLIKNNNVVQALPAYRADQPLHIGRLPWRARGRKYLFDTETFHSTAESITIDAVAVTQ